LEEQFTDAQELNKWNLFCKGIHEYDEYICNLYRYLDIKGFSPKISNTLVKLDLSNIYVPVMIKPERDHVLQQSTLDNIGESDSSHLSIDDALCKFNNLVILGDPGSGKSTLLKYLAHTICSSRTNKNQFEDIVPVFIRGSEFAKYVSTTSKNLAEFIINHLDKRYEYLFTQRLEKNQLLVLIDGIDEINVTSLRHEVVGKINAFTAQHLETKVIVSSRIVGYKETRLNGFFNHFRIVEFNKKQIQKFAKNWYSAISASAAENKESVLRKSEELYKAIEQNPSVERMAGNPLLITIIALIHHQGNTLPEKRSSLYDIATSTFLENWVKQRPTNKSNFDKDTLIEILAPISFYIHENYTTGLIAEGELKTLLALEYKKINPYLSPIEERQDLNDIIEFLREDAGFLFEKGLDEKGQPMFGFVHQTFQEYFSAIEFKTRWKERSIKQLGKYVFSSNWREVIKLTASLFKLNEPSRLGRKYATNFVNDILNVEDPFPEMFRPLRVVVEILKDDTEIDFNLFVEIINKVFNNVLNQSERLNNVHNREVSIFKLSISGLIKTKSYQSYIVTFAIEKILKKRFSNLTHNLLNLLIKSSDVQVVQDELIKILQSSDSRLKNLIFNYSIVWPPAPIVRSKEFKDAIVSYVNSKVFVKNYDGHIPTQYEVCFESESDNLAAMFDNLPVKILAIKLIHDEKIRLDLINFYVFSIGLGDSKSIKEFVRCVKEEFPTVKLERIENHIKELEKFESMNLTDYEIFVFKSTRIHGVKGSKSQFAFIKDGQTKFHDYPFSERTLKTYFAKDSGPFGDFLGLVMPFVMQAKQDLQLNDVPTFMNFIKYEHSLHWSVKVRVGNLLDFALNKLFEKKRVNVAILKWMKGERIGRRRYDLGAIQNKRTIESTIKSSTLEPHEKLFLLNILSNKSENHSLVDQTIKNYRKEKNQKKKLEIRRVLNDVL
jgi:hypothetical protein